jgi:hypothetical protein
MAPRSRCDFVDTQYVGASRLQALHGLGLIIAESRTPTLRCFPKPNLYHKCELSLTSFTRKAVESRAFTANVHKQRNLMFLFPVRLESLFGTKYVLSQSACGKEEPLWGRSSQARSLVRSLKVSASGWRRILHDCYRSPHDLKHVLGRQSEQELVADLLAQGRLYIHELPAQPYMQAFTGLQYQDRAQNKAYRLLPSNGHLLSAGVSTVLPAEQAAAQAERFNLTDEQAHTLLANCSFPESGSTSQRLAQALARGKLIVTVQPIHSLGGKKSGAAEAAPASQADKPVALGPHEEAGYVPPPTSSAAQVAPVEEPKSLEECEQRLKGARQQLASTGRYEPKYSSEELAAMAEEGVVAKERFIVTVQKVKHEPDAPVGFKRPSGRTTAWTTTFDLAENADTDPELLCDLNGTPYDPNAEYEVIVIDQGEYYKQDGAVNFVPTYDRLADLGKKEFEKDFSATAIEQVMTPEYSDQYQQLMDVYESGGGKPWEADEIQDFLASNPEIDQDLFMTRNAFSTEIGANKHFSGDGVTKTTGASPYQVAEGQNGNLEMLLFEHNPESMTDLEERGAIRRIAAQPVKRKV